jgi:hypothetical protein
MQAVAIATPSHRGTFARRVDSFHHARLSSGAYNFFFAENTERARFAVLPRVVVRLGELRKHEIKQLAQKGRFS